MKVISNEMHPEILSGSSLGVGGWLVSLQDNEEAPSQEPRAA